MAGWNKTEPQAEVAPSQGLVQGGFWAYARHLSCLAPTGYIQPAGPSFQRRLPLGSDTAARFRSSYHGREIPIGVIYLTAV